MQEIAPGSILQRMFFTKRVKAIKISSFCEIGSGNGVLSNILLSKGLTGIGFDLNKSCCENNNALNKEYINNSKYKLSNSDFLTANDPAKYDFVFSCMVIEHLDKNMVFNYFDACKKQLNENGTIAVFVPSSMKYWGIEDKIAGHFKRYEFQDFNQIAKQHNLTITYLSGLTYPVSNWLFTLSNKIISKNEGHKENLSMQEQTIQSGNRAVKFKTIYPRYFKLILNPITMFPFYVLQKISSKNSKSMVIYCEFKINK